MAQMIFSHGEKGGVGKSMVANIITDYAIRHAGAERVLVVEGDTSIRDVADRYRGVVPGVGTPLNRPDTMASQEAVSFLFDKISEYTDAEFIVVNLPASAGETLDPIAADLIQPAAEAMELDISVAFSVGPGIDSVNTARQSQENGLVSIASPERRLAILNEHLGSRFAWSANFSSEWEGYETNLPPLLERVAERVRNAPGTLSGISHSNETPIMERLVLSRWLANADKIGEFFIGETDDDRAA